VTVKIKIISSKSNQKSVGSVIEITKWIN